MLLTTLLLSAAPALSATASEVTWHEGPLSRAVSVAAQDDRMLLLYFWRDQSEYCARFWQDTLTADDVQTELSELVCYHANGDSPAAAALIERFAVPTLPWVVLLGPDGEPEDALGGYVPHDDFLTELARIRRGEGTRSGLERELAAVREKDSVEDFELRFLLAGKLQELGAQERHDELIASVRADDPEGATLPGARAHLWLAASESFLPCSGEEEGHEDGACKAAWTDAPLVAFASSTPHATMRFDAWNRVARLHASREEVDAACQAFARAQAECEPDALADWAHDVARWLVEAEGEPTKKNKHYALELAELALERTEAVDPTSEAYRERYGEYERDQLVAGRMSTLALALALNGKRAKARNVARKAVELAEIDATTEVLERLEDA